MKRIIGRPLMDNQVDDYSKTVEIPEITPDGIDIKRLVFRFQWANDIMDSNIRKGLYYRRFLDVGAYDGELSMVAALKTTGHNTSETIIADAVEPFKPAYDAAVRVSEIMRSRGFHINAHNVTFEDYKTDNLYDIICAFEFLEHTKDPLFCVEKMYDLLQIGGELLITVPEERGKYGLEDRNPYHYWASTIQSLTSMMFHEERKWRIQSIFIHDDLIHAHIKKAVYMV